MFNNVINTYSEIINRFRHEVDASAVLAGGCLRDTHYGVEVKDLDFVLQEAPFPAVPWSPTTHSLVEFFPDKELRWVSLGDLHEQYPEAAGGDGPLIDVIESTDKTINIIIVRSVPEYTQSFPDSISEMVFDGTTVHTSSRWNDGDRARRVYYNRDKMTPARLEKLERKYPTWTFMVQPEVFPFPPGVV